ncbi:MAG: L,D-transpeptidase family protein [Bacteroidales bacterium]|nr:L,D-transpeptidase family protein [Bacteroidales bacterium]
MFVILILFAGHESANPELGKTSIEFYNSEFRQYAQSFSKSHIDTSDNISKLVHDFYIKRQYMAAWTLNFEANSSFSKLYELLSSSYEFGLYPSKYSLFEIMILKHKMALDKQLEERINARVKLEYLLTYTAFRFMIHISCGYGNNSSENYIRFLEGLPSYLNFHLNNESVYQGIIELQPVNKEYVQLQHALHKYIQTVIPDTVEVSTKILKGNLVEIVKSLSRHGFLQYKDTVYTTDLEEALRKFQRAHALEASGVADENTVAELGKSTMEYFNKIALNLNRIKKDELSKDNYILVNIPAFQLNYMNGKGQLKVFNVIVGRKYTPTPDISSRIERIVANPHWTVPRSITYNEIIPKLRKDSSYLDKHGFIVIDNKENAVNASEINWDSVNPNEFNYWIRQKNSSRNALGRIKFLFPNNYRVYLHDTQSKSLFNKKVRAYSHGCVRVQNPEELAQYIIEDYTKGNNKKLDIRSIIKAKTTQDIYLEKPLSVFIKYYTCTADSTGNIQFYPDIYSRDEKALETFLSEVSI